MRGAGPTAGPAPQRPRPLAVLALTPLLRYVVARHCVPSGTPRRSGCDACGTAISLARPWPALGPRARCGGCGARVGAPPAAVEVTVVAAIALLLLAGPPTGELAATAWWLAFAVPLTFVDVAVHRLPDRLTLPAAAGTWLLLGIAALAGAGAAPWWRATAAGLGLAFFFAATTLLLGARGFGIGDAKLALGAGALLGWYGWTVPLLGLLLALTLSGLVALVLLVTRRAAWSSHLPFGPYLVLGTLGALLLVW
ncbi:prepilin peptidase [Micromonospora endophytica]|uniref:Prepilin peptidase n=1 Tax=Micromonospora endophytica TaxID=515350 RepID=A0A2W2DFL5_9ACTN|nr:A24 family peptidase [Micromonospora endophytica]PZF99559.1 prepilin peptidase [Micromonospora endophytica]RIW46888.1 prepilin peptidase [Micromonospora endophytica]